MVQVIIFFLTPAIVIGVIETEDSPCADIGTFVYCVSILGGGLAICYCWGRYYANKLAYA